MRLRSLPSTSPCTGAGPAANLGFQLPTPSPSYDLLSLRIRCCHPKPHLLISRDPLWRTSPVLAVVLKRQEVPLWQEVPGVQFDRCFLVLTQRPRGEEGPQGGFSKQFSEGFGSSFLHKHIFWYLCKCLCCCFKHSHL